MLAVLDPRPIGAATQDPTGGLVFVEPVAGSGTSTSKSASPSRSTTTQGWCCAQQTQRWGGVTSARALGLGSPQELYERGVRQGCIDNAGPGYALLQAVEHGGAERLVRRLI